MRRLIFALLLVLIIVALVVCVINLLFSSESYYEERVVRGIPPLEAVGGRRISCREFIELIVSRNLTIYIPTILPKGFSLTAIWARDTGNGLDLPIILVYSKR